MLKAWNFTKITDTDALIVICRKFSEHFSNFWEQQDKIMVGLWIKLHVEKVDSNDSMFVRLASLHIFAWILGNCNVSICRGTSLTLSQCKMCAPEKSDASQRVCVTMRARSGSSAQFVWACFKGFSGSYPVVFLKVFYLRLSWDFYESICSWCLFSKVKSGTLLEMASFVNLFLEVFKITRNTVGASLRNIVWACEIDINLTKASIFHYKVVKTFSIFYRPLLEFSIYSHWFFFKECWTVNRGLFRMQPNIHNDVFYEISWRVLAVVCFSK